MITNVGKRHMLNYIANKLPDRSRYIGIGIGSTAANVSDTRLEFEINKYKVYTSYIDYANNTIIMKAELPIQLSATITEIGLFPGSSAMNAYDSKFITFFNNDVIWSNGTYIDDSAVSKINKTSFKVTANSGASVLAKSSSLPADMTGYSNDDSLSIAFYENDTNLDYIELVLYSSDNNYYTYRIEGANTVGHRVVQIPFSSIITQNNTTGSPTLNIENFGLRVKANSSTNTSVDFDGLRVNDNDTFVEENGIISRAVLATPIQKEFGSLLDIEYRLVVD
jgi:hypothetical protein